MKVIGFLDRLDDLESFVQQVLAWIDKDQASPVKG